MLLCLTTNMAPLYLLQKLSHLILDLILNYFCSFSCPVNLHLSNNTYIFFPFLAVIFILSGKCKVNFKKIYITRKTPLA